MRTYEGDLLRLSGASWTLGREPNATYGEPHAGVQAWPVQSPCTRILG